MTRTVPLAIVTLPVLRAMLDQVGEKNYRDGVLGVRAQPRWDGPVEFTHRGTPVSVVACESALAVRETLLTRQRGRWLVVITDRDHEDLGTGILAHLVGNRMRQPDEWEALRLRFRATGLDPALFDRPDPRPFAAALLAVEPGAGWPPAPGGNLTLAHAMTSVARLLLGVDNLDLDGPAVLAWSTHADAASRITSLRSTGGDELADAVLAWLAGRLGAAAAPVTTLLHAGRVADVVPLGLALNVLTRPDLAPDIAQVAREALIRLEPVLGGHAGRLEGLRALGAEATRYLDATALDRARLINRADSLLADLRAQQVAEISDILLSGYRARLGRLADAVRRAAVAARARPDAADAPLVDALDLAAVETCWAAVRHHEASRTDAETTPWAAAVRLARWLATATGAPAAVPALIARHLGIDAWVDSALNDAAVGSASADHGAAIELLLEAVRRRRDAHDMQFATALAALTRDDPADPGVDYLENVLAQRVLPVANRHGVLLLVLDGMSAGAATEILTDALAHGWREAVPASTGRRAGALAVLPTITEVSRTSLLTGQLGSGSQGEERNGFRAMAKAHSLNKVALFHKKPLDSSRPGLQVADDVGLAIDDTDGLPLVGCVLNTIDDALDRSDPGGAEWTLGDVKHLRPLLERARAAGRVVVLTADHGHIVERRQGIQRPHPGASSGRSRPDDGTLEAGEALIFGRRVLKHDGRAVLAVDERLRYGPLKAGYHGGASPAEAIVPVLYLLPAGVQVEGLLREAPPLAPLWWDSPVGSAAIPEPVTGGALVNGAEPQQQQLFAVAIASAVVPQPADAQPPTGPSALATAVIDSAVYTAQERLAGRGTPSKSAVVALLDALTAVPGTRLPEHAVASVLDVGRPSLRGAVAAMQRLLNVEGYPVLDVDTDGSTLVLDVPLLREQFGIRA